MDQINRWRKPPAGGQGSQDGVAQPVTPAWPTPSPQHGPPPPGSDSDDAFNPPWERDSGLWPAPSEDRQGQTDESMLSNPYMEPLVERSLPGVNLQDVTGTGKIAALPPLRTGASWSRGLRAPRPTGAPAPAASAGVEVDQQPSMHIAALRSSTLIRATTIVSAALLISRIFGMLRTTLFAAVFPYGNITDAYTLAFTLPDAIFNIVAGGALASAIIPVFNDYIIKRKDREGAWRVASMALNTAMIALVIFCIIAIIFAEPVMRIFFSPAFVNCGSNCYGPQAIPLTRIMLLQPIFLGGATVAIALLQARQSFVAPAIGQVIYTVSIVGGIGATLLDNRTGVFGGDLGIYGPTWGVVIGAILQFLIQIPGLVRAKMQYTPAVSVTHPGILEIARLMGPRVLNSAVLYTSVFINRFLLTGLVAAGVLTGYNTAFSLIQLPNGVIGMALAQAAFPTLSTLVSAGEWDRLRQNVLRAIQAILFLAIPSSLGLIVFARPISRALLDYHNFDPAKLPTVYEPLIFFAIGLTGLSLVEILTRSFYALENTRTPTQVSILQFMFVIGMSILLEPWGAAGIALASSIAWLGEALVMLLLLRQELAGLDLKEIGLFTLKVFAASVFAVLGAAVIYQATGLFISTAGPHSIFEMLKLILRLAIAAVAGVTAYFYAARFMRIDSVLPLERLLNRIRRRGR
ncbi:MAG TPA: murein biosynthesis integral membrane protein MurJ [Ktedonobacterales bacterium]|nr:murein biosynthesis integral membrane protein MurJ [Ktedonobacterales bacterium]